MTIEFWAWAAGTIPIWLTGILIGYGKGYNDRSEEVRIKEDWLRMTSVPERELGGIR